MTSQMVQVVDELPQSALDAAAAFARAELARARATLAQDDCHSLVILLPSAAYDHADWRRALARDLAREYAPKRVNVVAASNSDVAKPVLEYLENAPGITGQYLEAAE